MNLSAVTVADVPPGSVTVISTVPVPEGESHDDLCAGIALDRRPP